MLRLVMSEILNLCSIVLGVQALQHDFGYAKHLFLKNLQGIVAYGMGH